jgi:hypothetical protein
MYGGDMEWRPTVGKSAGEGCSSAGSETDGTDGAGLTSQIDVQSRGEIPGLAHSQETCSENRTRQCHFRLRLTF